MRGKEKCHCIFILKWLHGPNKGFLTTADNVSIRLHQKAAAPVHPTILRFSIAAKERISSKLAKSTAISKGDVEENSRSFVKRKPGFQACYSDASIF